MAREISSLEAVSSPRYHEGLVGSGSPGLKKKPKIKSTSMITNVKTVYFSAPKMRWKRKKKEEREKTVKSSKKRKGQDMILTPLKFVSMSYSS